MAVALIWQGMPEICGFFTRPGSPRNPGIVCCLAREVMLLWFGLPQKHGFDYACHAFPGHAFLARPARPARPAFAGLSGLLTALLMQGCLTITFFIVHNLLTVYGNCIDNISFLEGMNTEWK